MNTQKISTGTIARTIVLVLALLNQVLTMIGLNPLPYSEGELYEGITTILTALASLWTWWKNQSFTNEAIIADNYMKKLKEGK